jgi:hypothetical protein
MIPLRGRQRNYWRVLKQLKATHEQLGDAGITKLDHEFHARGHPVVVLFCAWNELWKVKWTAWTDSMGSRLLGLSGRILRLACCLFCCPFWHPNG